MIDIYGNKLIKLCKATSLVISNGRLYRDTDGLFIFYSSNGSGTVDYLLIEADNIHIISDYPVLDPNEFSNNCGLEITLRTTEKLPTVKTYQVQIT